MMPYSPPAHLPPFRVLTTMEIETNSGPLSARLASFLSSILSAPTLSSITFRYLGSNPREDIPVSSVWKDVDRCLARLAAQTKRDRSLRVVLVPWPVEDLEWEGCLPEFRKAGGELKVEFNADDQ